MEGTIEERDLEKVYELNPFLEKTRSYIPFSQITIHNLEVFNRLTPAGRRVAKYVAKNLNLLTAITNLEVEKICTLEFGVYHETHAKRVRRGINDLIANEVIARHTSKNYYFVNRDILWK